MTVSRTAAVRDRRRAFCVILQCAVMTRAAGVGQENFGSDAVHVAALGVALIAVGETVILLTPLSPSLLIHLMQGEGVQQSDSLANG